MIDDEGEEDYDDDPFEQVFEEAEDLRKNNGTAASGKRPLSRKYITPSTANKIDSSKIDQKYIADKDVFEEAQKQRQSAENIEVIEAKPADDIKVESQINKEPVAQLPAKIKKAGSKKKSTTINKKAKIDTKINKKNDSKKKSVASKTADKTNDADFKKQIPVPSYIIKSSMLFIIF